MILTSLIAIFLILLFPLDALAWGPATHLEYASRALGEIAVFAPAVKMLLTRFQDHFLYGSVAADITLGKGLRGYLYNCHNWTVAFDIFNHRAKKDHQKAFMLGYLGHLAADTVSHNLFVPFKMIRSWKTKFLQHVYWEMRMDLSVPDKYWKLMEELSDPAFEEDDALLEGALKRTFFSFKTNKKIFNSLLVIQRMRHYRTMALSVADKAALKLEPHDIHDYKELATASVIDFLKNLENSYVLKADPTGKKRMVEARNVIRQIRAADQKGEMDRETEFSWLKNTKAKFQQELYAS
ncbi:MAG: zinc dependent phospholipase C family protein [Deltaproteobacteria bacterium]|nr:zinc dependent phospholipase C family protein [Deltaproteobacteria bacterium]